MNQYGLATATATTSVAIDQLTYTPVAGTNRLQSVSDAANGNTPAPGAAGYIGDYHYASGASSGAVYSYDNNGNLTSDNNKKISGITYNYLNLPQTITVTGKGTITYTYDAVGTKLQKQTVEGATTTTTLYGAGSVYVNNVLQFAMQEEGRIRINSTNNGYIFDYFLKDHLGNTRMTITDDNTVAKPVLEAMSYYPFGLTMAGISSKAAGGIENKIKFQGQELQHNEFSDGSGLEMYQFKYRMDDPQIGRFWQIDPLAEKYVYNSTYAFSENKVTGHVELEGLESLSANDLNNPYLRALAKDNVQKDLANFKSNSEEAVKVKVSVGPGVGLKGGVGKVNLDATANGPQAEVSVNGGGEVEGKGSLAGVGLNAETSAGRVKASVSAGVVKVKDGKVTVSAGEGKLSVSKDVKDGNVSQSGKFSILDATVTAGAKIGIIGVEASVNVYKASVAVKNFFSAGINYLKNVIDEKTKIPTSSDYPQK